MVSPYITKLMKLTGKNEHEVEYAWEEAKRVTSETLGKTEDKFGKTEYDYAFGIVMNLFGKKEAILNPEIFINSEKSAKDFLEEMISGDFNIPEEPITIKNKDDNKDETEDEKSDK